MAKYTNRVPNPVKVHLPKAPQVDIVIEEVPPQYSRALTLTYQIVSGMIRRGTLPEHANDIEIMRVIASEFIKRLRDQWEL